MGLKEKGKELISKIPEKTFRQKLTKSAILTLFVILLSFLASLLGINVISPKLVEQNAGNFEIYDLAYTGGSRGEATRDPDITLIKIDSSREAIANELIAINKFNPAVISLDVVFDADMEKPSDSLLTAAITNTGCIVANEIAEDSNGKFMIVKNYFEDGEHNNLSGYVNFYENEEENWPVTRTFFPFYKYEEKVEYSLAARVVEQYAPEKFQKLQQRKNKIEWINYSGVLEHYTQLEAADLLTMDSLQLDDKIRSKIVLVGYFTMKGENGVLEDLHYTPLNVSVLSKSPPDTYGIGIHANIISMLLSGKYIKAKSKLFSYFIAFILVFISSLLAMLIPRLHHSGALKTMANFVCMFLFVWFCLLLFERCRIRIPIHPIVVTIIVKELLAGIVGVFGYLGSLKIFKSTNLKTKPTSK